MTTHFQYQPWKRGPWAGFNWRYDSGLVAGAVPFGDGAVAADELGRVLPGDVARRGEQRLEVGADRRLAPVALAPMKRTAGIPVVALTGHALAGISEGAKKAGCDAFVTKPCLPEDLVKEIQRILDDGSPSRKARRSGKHAKTIG